MKVRIGPTCRGQDLTIVCDSEGEDIAWVTLQAAVLDVRGAKIGHVGCL
jgi:hypothetical protein